MSEGKGIMVNGNMSSDSACDILIVWFLWEEYFEFDEQCTDRLSKDVFLL